MTAPTSHSDPRIPALPADLLDGIDDPAQQAIAAAFWRIGYAACLNRVPHWRDRIPAGVLIGDDYELHSRRDQKD